MVHFHFVYRRCELSTQSIDIEVEQGTIVILRTTYCSTVCCVLPEMLMCVEPRIDAGRPSSGSAVSSDALPQTIAQA